ncbi:MAG TPA: peptidase M28, partial [Blastocatellia bacterium]|nr:peptidase M28 [Blastocatellia bacterium]
MLRRYTTALLLVINLLTLGVVATGQAPQEKVDLEVINKMKDEGLNRSQVMEILSYMTDVFGPRLTGSPNYREASEWAAKKLESWGLQNAKLEPWGQFGRGWTLEGFSANMIKPHFSPIIAYPKAWSGSTNGTVRGQVIYLDAKTEADLEKYRGKLKGAIVLIAPSREVKAQFQPQAIRESDEELLRLANAEPPSGGAQRRNFQASPEQRAAMALLNKKWEMVYSEGAAVVLETSRVGDGGTIFLGSATLSYPPNTPADQRKSVRDKDAPPVIPQLVVTVEHYNRIIRMLDKGVPVQLEVNVNARYHDQDLT